MPRIQRRATSRDRSHAHEERSHTGATSLAGDASKAQAEALTEQPQQPLHQTGRVTKLARIFGAGAATCGLLGLTLVGTAGADGPAVSVGVGGCLVVSGVSTVPPRRPRVAA